MRGQAWKPLDKQACQKAHPPAPLLPGRARMRGATGESCLPRRLMMVLEELDVDIGRILAIACLTDDLVADVLHQPHG